MKEIIREITMPWLTLKQKLIVWYFVVSFCLLASVADAPIWGLLFLLFNFANAARLIKQVPIPDDENDEDV